MGLYLILIAIFAHIRGFISLFELIESPADGFTHILLSAILVVLSMSAFVISRAAEDWADARKRASSRNN